MLPVILPAYVRSNSKMKQTEPIPTVSSISSCGSDHLVHVEQVSCVLLWWNSHIYTYHKASSCWIGGFGGWGGTHLVSLRFTWNHLDSLGLTWSLLNSLGLTWSHLDSFGLTWTHLGSLGLTWIHLDSFGLTWIHVDSLGLTWTHLDSLGLTCTRLDSLGLT